MKGATVNGTDTNNGSVIGVSGEAGSVLNLENCNVTVDTDTALNNYGVSVSGSAVLENCVIEANTNNTANAAGTAYASTSRGIYCIGSIELYNCTVFGATAGVYTAENGSVYVDGGEYTGYNAGGFYLAAENSTNYIYNSKISWAPMPEGKIDDGVAGTNGAGMYINANNVKLYMDNCEINHVDPNGFATGSGSIPLYGMALNKPCEVYISNTTVHRASLGVYRSNGNSGREVFNGVNNNYNSLTLVTKGAVTTTDTNESYAPTQQTP